MTHSRGFTLIELLVVIAIIGLLSAIVLASLNTARSKGQDAARISDVKSLETAMELYYSNHNGYPNIGGSGYPIAQLTPLVSDGDISSISAILTSDNDQMVSGPTQYGFYVYIAVTNSYCLTGSNVNPFWWGSAPACNF